VNLWRLELLRLTRSRGGLALGAVYLVFGFLGPVLATYLPNLVKYAQSGVTITMADPTPKDGIREYVSQVGQTGLIVLVAVAASALSFDSRRGLSTFLRTRASSLWILVAPRYVVVSLGAAAVYTLGMLVAWYETRLLIGALPVGSMLVGLGLGCLYLGFATAVTTAAASVARSTVGSVGLALAVLLFLPLAGLAPAVHSWLPSTLASAPFDLLATTTPGDYVRPALVSVAAGAVLVATAVTRLHRREI